MSAFQSIFHGDGPKQVGDVYRERLGGPPFPITRNEPAKPRWFCEMSGCTRWTDGDGKNQGGSCHGDCLYLG